MKTDSLHSLTLEDFVEYTRPRPTIFLFLSICFEFLYWLSLLYLLVDLVSVSFNQLFLDPDLLSFFQTDLIVSYAFVVLLGRLSRRFRVNSAKRLQHETRAPIMYLRSFYLENMDGDSKRSPTFFEKEHDDEVLASVLKGIGPLIAVGRPGDRIPPLGSIRLYFKDDEWREQVRKLIAISQLVIIQPGYTEGTEWEMQEVKSLPPEKLLYSFLAWERLSKESWQSAYGTFAVQFKRLYNCDLPANPRKAYFLYFDKEWKPFLTKLGFWESVFFRISSAPHYLIGDLILKGPIFKRLPIPKMFREYSIPSVRESLRPVFAKRGMYLPVWRTVAFVVTVLGLVSVISLFAIRRFI